MTFEEAFKRLLHHEGGYSNHQEDNGGETNWGVTHAVARAEGYIGPMQAMPLQVAQAIYRRRYWDAIRADALPIPLRFPLFDAAVNSGPGRAVRWLQRAAGVVADGVIGPVTLAAVREHDAHQLAAKMSGQRLEFLAGLPDFQHFGRGWVRRVASNLSEA